MGTGRVSLYRKLIHFWVSEMMRIDKVDRDLLALMGLFALATYCAASVLSYGVLAWGDVLSVYLQLGILATSAGIVAIIVQCTLEARRTGVSPLMLVGRRLRDLRFWAWLTVPALIAPIFMASFTITKILIGRTVGFTWDPFFADLDATIFGMDPWRLTHAVFGSPLAATVLEGAYVGWGAVGIFSMPLVVALASRDQTARFLIAMLLTWAVAGLLFAAMFASAGPCFAHIFAPEVSERFQPLIDRLGILLGSESPIHRTQAYLAANWNAPVAIKGGGISAFPSVHVGVAALYVIAAWRQPALRIAAIGFALMIGLGSVYFGYHYVVDGIASIGIAYGCWVTASKIGAVVASRHQRTVVLVA